MLGGVGCFVLVWVLVWCCGGERNVGEGWGKVPPGRELPGGGRRGRTDDTGTPGDGREPEGEGGGAPGAGAPTTRRTPQGTGGPAGRGEGQAGAEPRAGQGAAGPAGAPGGDEQPPAGARAAGTEPGRGGPTDDQTKTTEEHQNTEQDRQTPETKDHGNLPAATSRQPPDHKRPRPPYTQFSQRGCQGRPEGPFHVPFTAAL